MDTLENKLNLACWIAQTFFDRNLGAGTSGNLSFMHEGKLYITASNTCFGRLIPDDFSVLSADGTLLAGRKPSKEWPLHLAIYEGKPVTGAVMHIHSTYSVLWSCLPHESNVDCVPAYTPYLRIKLGRVGLVPYAKPGSEELLALLRGALDGSDGWLLGNHGLLAPGKDLMGAFSACEELESACRIAWELKGLGISPIS